MKNKLISLTFGVLPIFALPTIVVSCDNNFNLETSKYKLELYKGKYSDKIFDYKFYEFKNDILDNQKKWFLLEQNIFGLGSVENEYQKDYDNFCRKLAKKYNIKNFKKNVEVIKMW